MQDIRHRYDPYPFLGPAYQAAPSVVPRDATVLSPFTYDTYYYTRRKATWPLAWGRVSQLAELFRLKDPDRFLAVAREHGIDYLLMFRWRLPEEFLGPNYNRSFGECVEQLVRQGRMRMVWKDERMAIIAVNP